MLSNLASLVPGFTLTQYALAEQQQLSIIIEHGNTASADFVIYSVAADGKDDEAQADWKFGQQPGDWAFRLLPEVP